MKSGIYIIKNAVDSKVYIGQSVDIDRRINDHKNKLKKNKHPNSYLQNAVNKFGYDKFEFFILEECDPELLDTKEQFWITKYNSMDRENGYNRESGGNEGRVYSEERKKSISGSGNPMYGKHHSKECVEYIRNHNRGLNSKLTKEQVADIKQSLCNGETQTELSHKYNVAISTIDKIHKCKNWEWVCPELNPIMREQYLAQTNYAERQQKAKYMFDSGYSLDDIAKSLKISVSTARLILKDDICERSIENQKEREFLIKNVIKDFKSGISKDEIMKKYNISSTTYVRYVSEPYSQRKQNLIKKCKEMRQSGYMVKDIAKELGFHRTTVSNYCK